MLTPHRLIEQSRLTTYGTRADYQTAIDILKHEVLCERKRTRELRQVLQRERSRTTALTRELEYYRRRACTEGFLLRARQGSESKSDTPVLSAHQSLG